MTETSKSEYPQVVQLFKDNPIYKQLKPRIQRSVDMGIQEELAKIARNRILSAEEREEYRTWYLEKEAPLLLKNMLDGQMSMDGYLKATATDARNFPAHSIREKDVGQTR